MAYLSRDLSVLAYANGFTSWHYLTHTDTAETIKTQGYFNAAHNMLRSGDLIVFNAADANGFVFVTSTGPNGMIKVA